MRNPGLLRRMWCVLVQGGHDYSYSQKHPGRLTFECVKCGYGRTL